MYSVKILWGWGHVPPKVHQLQTEGACPQALHRPHMNKPPANFPMGVCKSKTKYL